MKNLLTKLLFVLVAGGIVTSAYSLTIIPTYDSSITTAANAAAITNAINYAIGVMQSNITDNVTVKIKFVSDESVGLGQSDTFGNDYDYLDFINALISHAKSVTDTNALSNLPVSTTDPVIGGNQIFLNTAQARCLGLHLGFPPGGFDSTISCKMSLMNFTRPPANPHHYDLPSVVEHEMDEVLGISSELPNVTPGEIFPADLFRYTTNLVRTFTDDGDDAYFSADGTNLVARYNNDGIGDSGDWWSHGADWSPVTGVTNNYPQVQDAYGTQGSFQDLGVSERTILDVVGWTVSAPPAASPSLKIVSSGANQFTVSWTNTATGFVLQERTNLVLGSWTFSTSGGANPAVLQSTSSQKFYRLFKSSSSQLPAQAAAVVPAAHGAYRVVTHFYQPR
jgi:hypothetical protein